jgi:hypothetical protein
MKNIQVPQQPSKIVVESRDCKETINIAKLQNGMLQLFYATGDINWDDGVIKNIKVATFLQGFRNLLARSTSDQATQLSNLFITIFQTEPEDDDVWNQMNPLNRLMSLVVFPPKFTKGHLNASFQSLDLETGLLYKSMNINPFCTLHKETGSSLWKLPPRWMKSKTRLTGGLLKRTGVKFLQ